MKRFLAVITMVFAVVGIVKAAPAEAHQAQKPHNSCAELDGSFSNFPSGPQTVVLHYTVDGVPQPDVPITGTGPNFDTSFGYFNQDRAPHVVTTWFTWTADGGGRSESTTTTITNCQVPASQEQVNNLQIQLNNLNQQFINTVNYLQVQITDIYNRVEALSCQSDRVYSFLIRTSINGSPVVAVDRGLVRNQAEFWSVSPVTRNGAQRFLVTADYRGLRVPKGQVRTVTSFVRTADGRTYRTVQLVRLCMANDGNPNDTSSQGRARV